MKKQLLFTAALLALMAVGLLGSCEQKGELAAKQHIIDSLVKLVPPGKKFSNGVRIFPAPSAAQFLVPSEGAFQLAEEMHIALKSKAPINWATNRDRTMFLVPRVTLDTLINSLNSDFIAFYIGYDMFGTQELELYYRGVQFVPNSNDTLLTGVNITDATGVSCMFDLSYPCPQCDSVDIHSPNAIPPVSVTSWVADNGFQQEGFMSPAGDTMLFAYTVKSIGIQYKFGVKSKQFELDSVVVDGVSVDSASSFTFPNIRESHEIYIVVQPAGTAARKRKLR